MLHFILVLAVVVLAAFLIPLLIQLHRTAKAVEALAENARQDLASIAEDVHEARLQMEKVATLAEQTLAFPAAAGSLAASLTRSLGTLLTGTASPWMEAAVAALRLAIDYLRRPKEASQDKEKTDE